MRDGVGSNGGRLTRPDPLEPTTWSVPARGREDYTVAPYCHVQYSGIFYLNGRDAQKMNAKSQLDPITERRRNQILEPFPQTTIYPPPKARAHCRTWSGDGFVREPEHGGHQNQREDVIWIRPVSATPRWRNSNNPQSREVVFGQHKPRPYPDIEDRIVKLWTTAEVETITVPAPEKGS